MRWGIQNWDLESASGPIPHATREGEICSSIKKWRSPNYCSWAQITFILTNRNHPVFCCHQSRIIRYVLNQMYHCWLVLEQAMKWQPDRECARAIMFRIWILDRFTHRTFIVSREGTRIIVVVKKKQRTDDSRFPSDFLSAITAPSRSLNR